MFRTMKVMVTAAAMLLAVSSAHAASDRVYSNHEVGIKLKRPTEWVFMSPEELAAAAGHEESTEGMLIAVARHPEPYPDLNATAQVVHVPLPVEGVDPERVLASMVRDLRMHSPEFEQLEEVHATKVSGRPAAAARIMYVAESPQGGTYRILSRLWVIVRGSDLFIIDMNGHAEGPEVSEEEFRQIFKSIRISRG